jgi:hypothetical protein
MLATYELEITLDNGDVFIDGMDAQTSKQALQLAYWNWECATYIQVIGVTYVINPH